MKLSSSQRMIVSLVLVVLLVAMSILVFLWYKGVLTTIPPVVSGTTVPRNQSEEGATLFTDPRFQKLRIQSQKPLEIGPVGNPNPFKPFESREQDIPIPKP